MPDKKVKLNALQSKTLVLLQVMAKDDRMSAPGSIEGSRLIVSLPHAHGNHMHVGQFVVASKDATGLQNLSVWKALMRKGFVGENWPSEMLITQEGLEFSTGLEDKFMSVSDH